MTLWRLSQKIVAARPRGLKPAARFDIGKGPYLQRLRRWMIRRLISLKIGMACWAWMRIVEVLRGLAGGRDRDECVVLYYHGVSDKQVGRFRRQMEWLAVHTTVVPLSQTAESGKGRRTCLTFDDGLDSVRRNALPVLRELRLPATIFVVPGNLGRKPAWPIPPENPEGHEVLSSPEQLLEFPADLMEIGSHTMTHPNLREISEGEAQRELVASRGMLEKLLARPVLSFAVPFGECHAGTLALAGEAGYRSAVTCEPRPVRPGDSLIGAGRFKVTPDDWMLEFALKAVGAYRWRRLWRRLRGETGMSAPERRSWK